MGLLGPAVQLGTAPVGHDPGELADKFGQPGHLRAGGNEFA
ncbi:hypothetical protein [Nocardia jiangxiensis]|nr:hypothetical protein [Nocardia jiangxiensis]